MNKPPGTNQTLQLLERFSVALQDFAAKRRKLEDEFRLKLARERQSREAALQELAQRSGSVRVEADVAHEKATRSADAVFEGRKTRIGKAYRTSKERALQRVEDQIGQRKYELQKQMLQATRDHKTSLTDAAAALDRFKSELSADQQTLASLEEAAQRHFSGYGGFCRIFARAYQHPQEPGPQTAGVTHEQLQASLRELTAKAQRDLDRFRRFWLLRLLRYLWVWVFLVLGATGLEVWWQHLPSSSYPAVGAAGIGALVVVWLIRFAAQRKASALARAIAETLARARATHDAALAQSEIDHQQETERINHELADTTHRIDASLKQALAGAPDKRAAEREAIDKKTHRVTARNEMAHRARQERLQREHFEAEEKLERDFDARQHAIVRTGDETERRLGDEFQAQKGALEGDCARAIDPILAAISSARAATDSLSPPWTDPRWAKWGPPSAFAQTARYANLLVNTEALCGAVGASERRSVDAPTLPVPAQLTIPLCLVYPEGGSILFQTAATGREQAIGALNNIILRLLSASPPGRLNFTIIDPVGLGQNFAGIMHLADYEEQIIHSRIWTQPSQIEERLAELNEHMEKVIQMYLRNEYETIAQYNEQAGVIAEKYHFLVLADFPVNISDIAAKRLMSIANSGARCGVYLLAHWDSRQPLPQDFVPEELRKSAVCLVHQGGHFQLANFSLSGVELELHSPPAPEQAIQFIQAVGEKSRDSSRVQVPFSQVAPAEADVWSEETTSELRVAIGRTGATKLQYLAIGKGTCQHGLVAGKTGSGKSTLFHVIITNLALWCSPEQVEFYLVDFKKGVEFKCYASRRLPHARVVAIESDREFGLSVLQRLDDELRRRGDLFRKLGVQDVPGYKKAGGAELMPRCLLLIDEFQEFFVEDDKIAQTASLLLDRIVRQGRAFGIHVVLGSQTLGGAYTVARTTLGQMVIRIALQCNEADAYLIMDDSNPAPRLLSRPGEGIYNDSAGSLEGNSPFQVVWLPDDERDSFLAKVRQRADLGASLPQRSDAPTLHAPTRAYPGPIVFEGNAPADIRENLLLEELLQAPATQPPVSPRLWLGAPNSIKGPTEVIFHRQSGNNLVFVGQRDEAILSLFSIGLVSLAAQYPPGAARIILCDSTPPGTPPREYLERLIRAIPHPITLAKQGELGELLKGIVADMSQRTEDDQSDLAPRTFLFFHGLHKFNKLRYEEDFGFSSSDADSPPNPAVLLNTLICDGTRLGFHVIASCDTYNNVNRFLSRKALSEFELRVLFQMSANDSASLIDNPKASALGLHRALFYNQAEGHLETFRPYALPGSDWIEQVERSLAKSVKVQS